MPLFGAHMSIAGGCHNAVAAAKDHGCAALQLFTKNSNQWSARDLTDDDVTALKDAIGRFRRTFEVTGGQLLVSDEEGVTALGEGESEQESVPRYTPPPAPADGE